MVKKLSILGVLALGLISLGFYLYSGDTCCGATLASNGCTDVTAEAGLSGCTPSNCRGAKTKFGEAKVITALRSDLIDLKTDMEKYKKVNFDSRSYDIHGIVGESDDESLEIIAREVRIIEEEFEKTFKKEYSISDLPENKAKKILALQENIDMLKAELE